MPSGAGCYAKDVSAPFRNATNPQYQRQSLGADYVTPLMKALQQQQQQQQQQSLQPLHAATQVSHSNTCYANNRTPNVLMPNNYGLRNNMYNSSTLFPPMANGPSVGLHKSGGFGVPMDKENIQPAQNGFVGAQDLMSLNYGNKFTSNFSQDPAMSNVFQLGCPPKFDLQNKGLLEQSTGQSLMPNRPTKQQLSAPGWKKCENMKESFDYWNTVKDVVAACWEPPKPDTPTELLNVPIPELKSINNLPPLNTPLEMLSEHLSKFAFDLDK
uniref:Uncharacterized protein n=1 Tax=Anopheles maculatus TaxID=74869 RepID=A0A182SRS6_9DIPT